MKKSLLVAIFVFSNSLLFAQDELIQKIGVKACKCIEKTRAINPDSCINKAYTNIIARSNSFKKIEVGI